VQLKVQIRELLAFAGRQSGEQALWHRRQIRPELADVHQIFVVGIWCMVVFASNEIVFDDQRLAWSEVAGVVERYGLFGRDGRALDSVLVSLCCMMERESYPCTFVTCHCMRSLTIHLSHSGL
jgi:hypothetical protein